MQNFNQIETLWASHSVEVKINADEMLKQVKKDVNNIRLKSILNIIGMLISVFMLLITWFFYEFYSWSTNLGLAITIVAILMAIYSHYKNYQLIANADFTTHPAIFLADLRLYQMNRYQLYSRKYWNYLIILSIGMILFFYKILTHLSFGFQVSTIAFSIIWLLFCSTLLRKAYLKREKERIGLLIEKFERLSGQFKEQN